MFDDQHTEQDMIFKSILENGQEEVPARVWDGVASELARREKAALWWRRTGVSVAAAAAVIAGVFLFQASPEEQLLPESEGIAVVAPADIPEQAEAETAFVETVSYMAYAPVAAKKPETLTEQEAEPAPAAEIEPIAEAAASAVIRPEADPAPETKTEVHEDWVDVAEPRTRKVKASLVVSSSSGANSERKTPYNGMLRRPISPNVILKTGITESGNNRFNLPLSFGVGTRIDLTEKWAVGIGLNYTLLTRTFDGDYLKVEDGKILEYASSEIRNKQHYICIPVNVYYNILSKDWINFYAYAGGAVEKGLSNKSLIVSSKSIYKEKIQGVQWSANLGIGVEFMFNKHIGLYIDPSARYYFNCAQPKSIRTAQPLMIGFELGLRTRF